MGDVKGILRATASGACIVVANGPVSDALFQIQGSRVLIGNNVPAAGTYLAPNAHIQIGNGALIDGALYGNKVSIKNGAVVNGAIANALLNTVSSEWIGWKDCKPEESSKSKSSKSKSVKSDSKSKSVKSDSKSK